MVWDFKDISRSNIDVNIVSGIMQVSNLVFSGMSSGFMIVNANWAGKLVYNLIYPFIPVTARANLSVSNADETPILLLERNHPDQLPHEFGGTGCSIEDSYNSLEFNL